MSQMTWTYVDDDGYPHKVGLFHGNNSGHLMVYCNTRIVVIDFNVLKSKNYSFFINEELCDISIEEKDGKFAYGFDIDKVTDTPRNRGRRKMIRSENKYSLLFAACFVLVIAALVWLVMQF